MQRAKLIATPSQHNNYWWWPTVFPWNLAAVRFYFKAPFGAATIWGRCLQRLMHTRVYSFNNKLSCMHVKYPCAYGNFCRPLTMQRDFEGGVYWDELADRCGDILRAAGFRGAARFRGNMVFWVRSSFLKKHNINFFSSMYYIQWEYLILYVLTLFPLP